MKVLVTGVKGQARYDMVNELTKRGIEAVGVDIQDMDITDAASVEKVIGEVAPDAVIHCAAYTAVDAAGRQRGALPQGQRGWHTEYCQCLQKVRLQDDLYQHGLCI